jgi:hypothetical protein
VEDGYETEDPDSQENLHGAGNRSPTRLSGGVRALGLCHVA